jgi:hypothetical protein
MFGVLLVLTVISFVIDAENAMKFDHGGITVSTVLLAVIWVVLGVGRELIHAIDPLM